MDILSNFSETLNDLFFDNGLTPESFAKIIGVDRSVIYKYQRREVLPSLENLIKIADYFNCSADYLLGLTTDGSRREFKAAIPFNERFKELLVANNTTRYKLQKCTKFARQSIDDWYNGKRLPTVQNAVELSKHFRVSIDCLCGRTEY